MPGKTIRGWCISLGLAFIAGAAGLLAVGGSLSADTWYDVFFVGLPRNLTEAMTPRGGERVLPPGILEAIGLLRNNGVERYRASPHVADSGNPLMDQRLVEGGWPIRQVAEAPWYLAGTDEPLPADCQLVEQRHDYQLARCP